MAPEVVRKTRPIQSRFACSEYNADWFINDLDEPYTTPPDQPFLWMGRLRITGGRTNVWGRLSLRYSDWDFKAASQDRKSTRLNSSHGYISYAVFCLKKKRKSAVDTA